MVLPLRRSRGLVVVAAVVTAAAVGPLSLLVTSSATAAVPIAAPRTDRTSPLEARRVDRVKLPKIDWFNCTDTGDDCALIRLPMDYDEPNGPTTQIALGRVKAAKPKLRIGTLFVNPGGPGSSAAELALSARSFLDQQILDRFDIVGIDPRGVGNGDTVRCFTSFREQRAATRGLADGFPVTPAEITVHLRATRAQAKGCGTTGGRLAASMSTAEVARDLDVVRRAVGDTSLTYLGFSYGTLVGQVYANLFPDRVRALALDGMIDPVATTTGRNDTGRTIPSDDRQRTADGSYAVFRELMLRCDKAGTPTCAFAARGGSLKKFDVLAQRLKRAPLQVGRQQIIYATLVSTVLSSLYDLGDGTEVMSSLQDLFIATTPGAPAAGRAVAGRRAVAGLAALRPAASDRRLVRWPRRTGRDFEYRFTSDARITVNCTDAVNPRSQNVWISTSKAADRRAPYFGSLWNWQSNPCASSVWTARDEDRYLGPFTRRTAKPVLMVGNYFDPATPYTVGAVAASTLLPNSRLLSSTVWGHTAYGKNPCVSAAVGAYLLRGTLPAKGAVCAGPQPFQPTAARGSLRRNGSTARPVPIRLYPPGLGG